MAIDIEAAWQRLPESERKYIDFLAAQAKQGDTFLQEKLLDFYDKGSLGQILERLSYGVHILDAFAMLRLGQQYTILRPRISGQHQAFDQDFEEAKRLLKLASLSCVEAVVEQAQHEYTAIFHRFSREYDPETLLDTFGTLLTGYVADGPSAYSVNKYAGNSTEPHVPAGIEAIRWGAFQKSHIEKVYLPFSLQEIAGSAFADCKELASLQLPNNVHTVDSYAFSGCKKLQSVRLSPAMTEIRDSVFKYCTALEAIRIPGNIRTIGREAFAGSGLKTVVLEEGVETIGQGAFRDTPLDTIYLPQSLRRIEKNAFAGCGQLKVCYGDFHYRFHRFDTFAGGNQALATAFSYIHDAAQNNYRLNKE